MGEAGAGLGWGPGPLAPPRAAGGKLQQETDRAGVRGALGPLPERGPWPSCLQYDDAFVSFIHFKYRQNKNHIFVRQQ